MLVMREGRLRRGELRAQRARRCCECCPQTLRNCLAWVRSVYSSAQRLSAKRRREAAATSYYVSLINDRVSRSRVKLFHDSSQRIVADFWGIEHISRAVRGLWD